ncbi:hypothetical protein KIPB_014743, partial [Kipferlia bialata]
EDKHTVSRIHGDMDQAQRDEIMYAFRKGATRILITTDLLARSIDVQKVSLVINFDFPKSLEQYYHRLCRSSRFGCKGVAINFMKDEEGPLLEECREYFSTAIDELPEELESLF